MQNNAPFHAIIIPYRNRVGDKRLWSAFSSYSVLLYYCPVKLLQRVSQQAQYPRLVQVSTQIRQGHLSLPQFFHLHQIELLEVIIHSLPQ